MSLCSLRVSSSQPRPFSVLGWFILGGHYYLHRSDHSPASTEPHRSHKCSTPPSITTKRLVWWGRPLGTNLGHTHRCRQSSSHPPHQSVHHTVRCIHRGVGETVDPILRPGHDVGEHRRPREETPGQVCGTPEVGTSPDHGVSAHHVTVRPPSFRHFPRSLSLGSERFRWGTRGGDHFYWRCFLRRHRRSSDSLERLPFPDALVCVTPKGAPSSEGTHEVDSRLVGAEDHCTHHLVPALGPTGGGA